MAVDDCSLMKKSFAFKFRVRQEVEGGRKSARDSHPLLSERNRTASGSERVDVNQTQTRSLPLAGLSLTRILTCQDAELLARWIFPEVVELIAVGLVDVAPGDYSVALTNRAERVARGRCRVCSPPPAAAALAPPLTTQVEDEVPERQVGVEPGCTLRRGGSCALRSARCQLGAGRWASARVQVDPRWPRGLSRVILLRQCHTALLIFTGCSVGC